MTCFVKKCKNIRRLLRPDQEITFHRFPSNNEEIFSKWLIAVGRQNETKWKKSMFICSDHFHPRDFIYNGSRRFLKKNAYPVLNLYYKSDTEPASETEQILFRDCYTLIELPDFSCRTSDISPKKKKLSVLTDKMKNESSPVLGNLRGNHLRNYSGIKRRPFKIIYDNYSTSSRQIQKKAGEVKKKYLQQHTIFYKASQYLRKLQNKVDSLRTVLKYLKSNHVPSKFALQHLSSTQF